MSEPVFPPIEAIIDIHAEVLEAHGGAPGLRDRGALEASLARARQVLAYDGKTSVSDLAAAICIGICRNHPFVDGNKRVAFAALGIMLGLIGLALDTTERDATRVIYKLAAGRLSETKFRAWVQANTGPDETVS